MRNFVSSGVRDSARAVRLSLRRAEDHGAPARNEHGAGERLPGGRGVDLRAHATAQFGFAKALNREVGRAGHEVQSEPHDAVRRCGLDLDNGPRELFPRTLLHQAGGRRVGRALDLADVESARALKEVEIAVKPRDPRRELLAEERLVLCAVAGVEYAQPGAELPLGRRLGGLNGRRRLRGGGLRAARMTGNRRNHQGNGQQGENGNPGMHVVLDVTAATLVRRSWSLPIREAADGIV